MTLARRFVMVFLGAAGALSCARGDSGAASWLGEALSANRQADAMIAQGDPDGARKVLGVAAERPAPRGADPRDVRVVRQDLLYRMAELDLGTGHVDSARTTASRGLDLGRGQDTFTANLLIVRGRAAEMAANLEDASRDYHDALVITDHLLDLRMQGVPKSQ